MKISIHPDPHRSRALLLAAQASMQRLEETALDKYPSNTLTDYYGIVHKLLDAISSIVGVRFTGDGSHAELIDFVCKEYHIKEEERRFLQELRDYRNRIEYEGYKANAEYIRRNRMRLNGLIALLQSILSRLISCYRSQ